jgi:hypothetical protein
MPITGNDLRAAYLTPPMLHYFRKKLLDISEDELLIRIEETLKFLTIAHFSSSAIPVIREIDDIWHYWILQTQEYEELCRVLPSGKFIHHSSNAYLGFFDPNIGDRLDLHADVKMLAIYVANFGPFAENRAKYWHLPAFLIGKRGWSVHELNDWLSSTRSESEGLAQYEPVPA